MLPFKRMLGGRPLGSAFTHGGNTMRRSMQRSLSAIVAAPRPHVVVPMRPAAAPAL